jgi:hypothetical protein
MPDQEPQPSTDQLDADVIIIGGGPGGATVGAYLARAGYRALILERDIHPREHVGESFVPATNIVTGDLGFWEKMESFQWIKKPGATWTGTKGKVGSEFVVTFADYPQKIFNPDYTYHVDRAIFDAMYLRHANELGAEVVGDQPRPHGSGPARVRSERRQVRVLGVLAGKPPRWWVQRLGRRRHRHGPGRLSLRHGRHQLRRRFRGLPRRAQPQPDLG